MLLVCARVAFAACADNYPARWWTPVERDPQKPWEILPQEAKCPDVILSKRDPELALLSNFAHTPFELDSIPYASIEGLWQMMKYPDPELSTDERNSSRVRWLYAREVVRLLWDMKAKEAGNLANRNLETLGILWWSYRGKKFVPRGAGEPLHLDLITRAMRAKLAQNLDVARALARTRGLRLLPDHRSSDVDPLPAWRYNEIWMKIRDLLPTP